MKPDFQTKIRLSTYLRNGLEAKLCVANFRPFHNWVKSLREERTNLRSVSAIPHGNSPTQVDLDTRKYSAVKFAAGGRFVLPTTRSLLYYAIRIQPRQRPPRLH